MGCTTLTFQHKYEIIQDQTAGKANLAVIYPKWVASTPTKLEMQKENDNNSDDTLILKLEASHEGEQQLPDNNTTSAVVPNAVLSQDGKPIVIYTREDDSTTEEIQIINDSPIARIESYLKGKYEFRRNLVSGYIEFRAIGGVRFEQVTDSILNSLWRKALYTNLQCTPSQLLNLLNSDFSVAYDPIIEYLDSLPVWDGNTDYIMQLAESVETTNGEFFTTCLRKWLVAMVGSWMVPDVVNQTVLVFSGAQGIGKTTWVNKLVPHQLKNYYYSGTINPNNKDTLIQLSECALVNLDELENLNKSEVGALKEIITKGQIRVRRPYGKSAEILPRRASFAGSVNQAQFLNDPTGSRRFLCFEALRFNSQHQIDMDLVYSQALALFDSKFEYWFNQEEIKELEANNQQYNTTPIEEEMLLQLFLPCNGAEESCEYLTATEIAGVFNTISNVRVDNGIANRIGKAATKFSFPRVKKQGIYKYSLKRKQDLNNLSENDLQGGEVSKTE